MHYSPHTRARRCPLFGYVRIGHPRFRAAKEIVTVRKARHCDRYTYQLVFRRLNTR